MKIPFLSKDKPQANPEPNLDGNVELRLVVDAVDRVLGPMAKQRQREQRFNRLKFFSIAAFVASLIFMNTFGDRVTQLLKFNDDYVNVVRVNGPIMPMSFTSPEMINPLLEKAFKDKNAKGIIIQINSPGGTPVASNEIRERIIDLRAEYPEREVIVVSGDMLTSGAYMIASGAPTIYANESSVVGSIGVIIRTFGFQDVMDKVGVERRVLASGEQKNGLDQYSPMTSEVEKENKNRLSIIHKHFKDMVSESRGDRIDLGRTPDLFTGKTWAGSEALDTGLIDGNLTLAQAAKKHFETTNFQVLEPSKPYLNNIGGGFAKAMMDAIGVEPATSAGAFGQQILLMPN